MDPRHRAEKIPAAIDLIAIAGGVLQLLAGPKDRPLGAAVEPFRVEHGALIVVTQQSDAALSDHQVEALAGVGTVADDVAQAVDFVDPLIGDMRHHGLQGFEVAVDVADDRALHRNVDPILVTRACHAT